MENNNYFYNDLMEALQEAIENKKGNIQLKTTSFEEVIITDIIKKLSDSNKEKLLEYANELLQTANMQKIRE